MASLRMRSYLRLGVDRYFFSEILHGIGRDSVYLIQSFTKIKKLSEDLFRTGEIQTTNDCMKVYDQSANNEPFNIDKSEIRLMLVKLQDEINHFKFCLERLFNTLYKFFPIGSNFRNNFKKAKHLFIKDLKYQLLKKCENF